MHKFPPPPLPPIPVPAVAVCKCCGTNADLYGVVDFHKNCEDRRQKVFNLSGVPIYYHRCGNCGFIFTIAFDNFSHLDFATHIYNDQYILVDPEYKDLRPRQCAQTVHSVFAQAPGALDLRILDYGGGSGATAQALREAGFKNVSTYDPFSPAFTQRPEGVFDLILCFEVMEHTPNPRQTLTDMLRYLKDSGMVFLSTLFQPAEIATEKVGWWYIAPRNGHVSIYTFPAMNALLAPDGYHLSSFNSGLHLIHRIPPEWAMHIFKKTEPGAEGTGA